MISRLESILNRFSALGDEKDFRLSFLHHLAYTLGKDEGTASLDDKYAALALAVRDRMTPRMLAARKAGHQPGVKWVYVFSMEHLIGRMLTANLVSLGMLPVVKKALANLGCSYEELARVEHDASLGNGGLGQLAAGMLESLAALGIPSMGYGILYEYGLFKQEIRNGGQVERPDPWLQTASPWLFPRPERTVSVPLSGRIRHDADRGGTYHPVWMDGAPLLGQPYDLPIVGCGGESVTRLRLFKARAGADFGGPVGSSADYVNALRRMIGAESVSKVLIPPEADDATARELRFTQEYFLVACGVHDLLHRYRSLYTNWDEFAAHVAIQLNDTHPALAVVELQRVFVDEAGLSWEKAWAMVQETCGATNHAMLPGALEKWPVAILERLLPRHLQIIYEINHRFLDRLRAASDPGPAAIRRLSLIEEEPERRVRMDGLEALGCHRVNGVSQLHARLLRERIFPDLAARMPDRFLGITNGVNHRRWLLTVNPELAQAVTDKIGGGWIRSPEHLRDLLPWAEDAEFQHRLRGIKTARKERLIRLLPDPSRLNLDTARMFDIQAKRLHDHKRQLLFLLHLIGRYLAMKEDGADLPPRCAWFAGKAGPGQLRAKLIVKLIHNLGAVVNADPETRDRLQVHFLPDYNVSLAEELIPAADLSEQIPLAGTEASGIGNMKSAMNGALLIGTLAGANIEIRDAAGADTMFAFGLTVEQAAQLRGRYVPHSFLASSPMLPRVFAALRENRFSRTEPGLFEPLLAGLLDPDDPHLLLADFASYEQAQAEADRVYSQEPQGWQRRVIQTLAAMGEFSSDRMVRDYARLVWDVPVGEVNKGRHAPHRRRHCP